jgi:hypothetical protein
MTTTCDGCGKELPSPPDPYGTVSLVLCAGCNKGRPVAGGHPLPATSQFERDAIYEAHDQWAEEAKRYDEREG